ncbi:MAG: substrate-binding domain-containing protein [Victivallales bacterium]|nr:substrate-binding domain-containing protein [Victivallales bacterium]
MSKRLLLSILPLALLIALPLVLRKEAEKIDLSADQLVIVSPHNESIRYEYEQAFRAYYTEVTGRKVSMDWRAPGGTGDAVRYVNSTFVANFKDYWVNTLKREWKEIYEDAFMNRRLKPGDEGWEAREEFLKSNVGIGIDLFFGGGQYDLNKQAQVGTLVETGLHNPDSELYRGTPDDPIYKSLSQEQRESLYPSSQKEPVPALYNELFGDNPMIVQRGRGEIWYDDKDRYYGTCFSSFGICQNLDRLKALGFEFKEGEAPLKSWNDMTDPRLYGQIGAADPTKSGSVNKCFEMMIQRQMQVSYAAQAERLKSGEITETQALDNAWQDAMTLIKKIGGNSSYLTFSASKVPVDVAKGQVAAGMCIDFYGESQAGWEERHVGRKTMVYHTPLGESSVSVDPIGIFRGAPNPEIARLFLRFIMSYRGQRIWGQRVGTEGGPVKYDLHRLPCRKDCYSEETRALRLSPDADPYKQASSFEYKGAWTAAYFSLIQLQVKVMVLDCQDELRAAWKAIIDAGGAEKVPEAYGYFQKLPFKHSEGLKLFQGTDVQRRTEMQREWTLFFKNSYTLAKKFAEQGK